MGEAITKGLSLIDNQRQSYRKAGVSSYKPWIVLLTDGEPNDWADPAGKAKFWPKRINSFSLESESVHITALCRHPPGEMSVPDEGLRSRLSSDGFRTA